MSSKTQSLKSSDIAAQLLKGREVAKILNISPALAYSWMNRGILPVFRVPGARSVRVPKAALDKWIEERTEYVTGYS